MLRLGSSWSPHLLPFKTATPFAIQIRLYEHERAPRHWPKVKRIPMRGKFETFEGSKLLFDLDAQEAHTVRPYDEKIDGAPISPEFYRQQEDEPAKLKAEAFEAEARERDEMFQSTAHNKFSAWRVLDSDIISAAIEGLSAEELTATDIDGLPESYEELHSREVRNAVLLHNGIPQNVWNATGFPKAIAYMLRRQKLARLRSPKIGDENELVQALHGCTGLVEIERIIANVIQVPQGTQLISNCTTALARTCVVVSKTAPPEHMLRFLNNIIINLNSKQLHISPSLIWQAYITSFLCDLDARTQKYLEMTQMIRENNYTSYDIQQYRVLDNPILMEDPEAQVIKGNSFQLMATYGYTMSIPPSLLSREDLFAAHINNLARLRAFQAMWHIWHRSTGDDMDLYGPNGTLVPKSPSVGLGNATKTSTGPDVALGAEDARENMREYLATVFSAAIGKATSANARLLKLPHSYLSCVNISQRDLEFLKLCPEYVSLNSPGSGIWLPNERVREIFEKPMVFAMRALDYSHKTD
ncbi:hypothetical protein F4804DRAFT_302799 [Jackrogersella minutella]|nr:hypothetical protein F4804DRAFT_302799 [Jackrogersella minutella]